MSPDQFAVTEVTERDVQAEYERLGYQNGWVFAMTPVANLPTAEVVIVGLNPGGDGDQNQGTWEVAGGNAYLDERWYADGRNELFPIQVEVMELLHLLGVEDRQVFAAQFIPFRSKEIKSLPNRGEAVTFARRLWSWALSQSPAKLIITMGHLAGWHVAQLIGASHVSEHPTGWGKMVAVRYVATDGKVVVSIPHPSRYGLLNPGRAPEKRRKAKLSILTAAQPVTADIRAIVDDEAGEPDMN